MMPRHMLMVGGLAIAAWLAFFGDKTPNDTLAEPVVRSVAGKSVAAPTAAVAQVPAPTAIASATSRGGKAKPEPRILALRQRKELIGGASRADESNAIFSSQSWVPPPPPPPKPVPPSPPTAPAVPFTFLGKKMEDASWEVYLGRGEETLIVRENTVITATYRIDAIKPPTLTMTYLPLNQMQTINIGGTD